VLLDRDNLHWHYDLACSHAASSEIEAALAVLDKNVNFRSGKNGFGPRRDPGSRSVPRHDRRGRGRLPEPR